jgi:hypothetical protein
VTLDQLVDPVGLATVITIGLLWLGVNAWEKAMDANEKPPPLEFGSSVEGQHTRYGEARFMKIYGKDADDRLSKPFEFGLVSQDNLTREETAHAFTAVFALSAVQVSMVLDSPEGLQWGDWFNILAGALDDSDGVPFTWKFEPRRRNPGELEAANHAAGREHDPEELVYEDPQGDLRPVPADSKDFDPLADFPQARWSSRRRFMAIYRNSKAKVKGDVDTLREITKDLVGASADRPTGGS